MQIPLELRMCGIRWISCKQDQELQLHNSKTSTAIKAPLKQRNTPKKPQKASVFRAVKAVDGIIWSDAYVLCGASQQPGEAEPASADPNKGKKKKEKM